ncbi:ankyrin-1-like, partial [Temnothorax curvispinosus]|uniref:Ankyrin-1-like n=1 Tax=Temnothorax curvispinosus TaxID=300111 RepID=A0A6J1RFA3_9HYME
IPLYYATNDSIKKILASTKEPFTQVKKGDLQKAKDCLHYAAWKGYVEITEVLLRNGANPNAAGKNGYMPLHYAAQFGKFKIVQLLLDRKADPNIQDDNGKTPLALAREELAQDPQIYQEIIDILKSKSTNQQQETDPIRQGGKVSAEECLPNNRKKKEAKVGRGKRRGRGRGRRKEKMFIHMGRCG